MKFVSALSGCDCPPGAFHLLTMFEVATDKGRGVNPGCTSGAGRAIHAKQTANSASAFLHLSSCFMVATSRWATTGFEKAARAG